MSAVAEASAFEIIAARITAGIDAMQEKNGSTMGQMESIAWGIDQWNSEMKKVVDAINTRVSPARVPVNQPEKMRAYVELKDALDAAQDAWLAANAKQDQAYNLLRGRLQGTMWGPVIMLTKMERIKERVQALYGIVDFFEDEIED